MAPLPHASARCLLQAESPARTLPVLLHKEGTHVGVSGQGEPVGQQHLTFAGRPEQHKQYNLHKTVQNHS